MSSRDSIALALPAIALVQGRRVWSVPRYRDNPRERSVVSTSGTGEKSARYTDPHTERYVGKGPLNASLLPV